MRTVFLLEILFIFLTFWGFLQSFQRAILGEFTFGFLFLTIIISCELFFRKNLLEFSPTPKILFLARFLVWNFSSLKFKEDFFSSFVVHCLRGDYPSFISDIKNKHSLSSSEIAESISEHFHEKFENLYPNWKYISYIAFLNYREVEQVSIYKIEDFDSKLIKTFKDNLQEIDLIVTNYNFYKFLKTKP